MNILEILREYNIPYAEAGTNRHVTQGWIGVDCLTCSPGSGKYKLGINLATGHCNCWTCGYSTLAYVLGELTGKSTKEWRERLKDFVPEYSTTPRLRGTLKVPDGVGPLLSVHKSYLRGRGFDPEELERLWGVKGIGVSGRLAWRLYIPITVRGQTVSWTTRGIGSQCYPRYINARPDEEILSAKQCLFGADLARHAAIIVEGPLDAMRIGPGGVALMGVNFSKAQVSLLSRFPVRAVCFDSEPQAQRRAQQLCLALAPFGGVTKRVVLDADDPGSASKQEIRQLRRDILG